MDFRFHNYNFVYGLPSHASPLNLKNTIENGEKHHPFRLYNLDVFEYEINEEMALYGHIPLVYAHNKDSTVGVFWLNSAETWVDVERANGNTDTHWFSESGIVDFFVMLGPKP